MTELGRAITRSKPTPTNTSDVAQAAISEGQLTADVSAIETGRTASTRPLPASTIAQSARIQTSKSDQKPPGLRPRLTGSPVRVRMCSGKFNVLAEEPAQAAYAASIGAIVRGGSFQHC